ncbi:hypothetical protein CVT25_005671 [Psilocybe cyanescens]|uniref:DUF1740-domain-containing protein n=1 Tax=Psilocybe cyanescens TaxID=93625 RepID=A0A409VLD4_PSICY|nr:hypothetical protein CVT25_005671 [Psilocybe cyanescens]
MSAPSFSSFPPSFSSFPDLDEGPSDNSTNVMESSNKPDKKKRMRHRDHIVTGQSTSTEREARLDQERRRPRSSKEKERSPRLQGHDISTRLAFKSGDSEKPNLLFYSDYRGDLMNIRYGGPHTGDIPRYRMVAGGRNVLGLPKAMVVLRRVGRGAEVGLKYQRKTASLSTTASRALLSKAPTRRLIPTSRTNKYEEIDGYISFPSRTAPSDADPSYRSIRVNNPENSENSSSSESEEDLSSDEDTGDPILTAHQETLKILQQEIEVRPDAADKWLSLLNQTLSTIPITSKNATKARSEISVSILSRAISASPLNAKNRSLRLAYLRAGEEIWHESKLRSEWEDALKVEDIEIQTEWLEWKIRTSNGGVDGVVQAAVRVLDRIGIKLEVEKVRIFWRVAMVIRNAGYSERAFAMFQAQAELIFNPPPTLIKMSFQVQLSELEEFWESEYPRFGENGAEGWSSWYSSKLDKHSHSVSSNMQQQNAADLDPYRQWANQELRMDHSMFLSQRSDSESSDPYSIVLFADLRSTLLELRSRDAKHAFRMAWLSFLGLNLPGFSLATNDEGDWDDRWNLNYLTTPQTLDCVFPSNTEKNNLSTDAVAGVVIGRERVYHSPFGPVRCWGRNVSGPLDLASAEPGKVLKRGVWSKGDLPNLEEDFVRRLFLGLKISRDDIEWDVLTLAFELAVNPKTVIKLSKALLAANQESLGLWDAHAQLERLRGRNEDARKVYQTILITSKPGKMKRNVSRLWWNWAEMEWLSNDHQQVLHIALWSVGLEGPLSRVAILRAKRSLEEIADTTRASNGWKEQEGWVKLRALLELLEGSEPEAAFSVFDKYLSGEVDKSCSESLMTASLVMIYCYGTVLKKAMPPAILRERAHRAFAQYPSNSIILGVLLEAERGQGVWGRVRSMLGGNDGKVKDVTRRVEEIWIAGWERGRWLSEVERTRNGLATAVEHERTRYSAIIWRIYIEFEIRVHELHRAKKLLFRAIGEWLYLLAFGPLRSVFEKHELNGLADTMAERGIRLHQGIDEALEGIEDMDKEDIEMKDEDSEESEDEIERDASELRRLMPY